MENEICQIAPLIKMISEGFERLANDGLKKYNLTLSQVHVLVVLFKHEQKMITLKELEKFFSFSSAAIAGIVNRLEEKEYVESCIHQEDKRVKCVQITKKGIELIEASSEELALLEKDLLEGFTEAEKRHFVDALQKMYEKVAVKSNNE